MEKVLIEEYLIHMGTTMAATDVTDLSNTERDVREEYLGALFIRNLD